MRTAHSTIHQAVTRQRAMACLQAKLLEKRQRLLERMETELAEPVEPAGVPGDAADMAHSTLARESSFEIGSLDFNTVAQIDHVLRRIESGRYGVCEDCGKRIPEARLSILPFACLCIECKKRDEQETENREMEAAFETLDLPGDDESETREMECRQEIVRGNCVA